MSLDLLDAVGRIPGIRGHIPHDGNFGGGGRNQPSLVSGQNRMMWIVGGIVVAISLLSLILWATVWLVLKLL
jgi:hypothetical protein